MTSGHSTSRCSTNSKAPSLAPLYHERLECTTYVRRFVRRRLEARGMFRKRSTRNKSKVTQTMPNCRPRLCMFALGGMASRENPLPIQSLRQRMSQIDAHSESMSVGPLRRTRQRCLGRASRFTLTLRGDGTRPILGQAFNACAFGQCKLDIGLGQRGPSLKGNLLSRFSSELEVAMPQVFLPSDVIWRRRRRRELQRTYTYVLSPPM